MRWSYICDIDFRGTWCHFEKCFQTKKSVVHLCVLDSMHKMLGRFIASIYNGGIFTLGHIYQL